MTSPLVSVTAPVRVFHDETPPTAEDEMTPPPEMAMVVPSTFTPPRMVVLAVGSV
jgi:hypothetical protein